MVKINNFLFQSSPGPKTGCHVIEALARQVVAAALFQSSPGPKTGCHGLISPSMTRRLPVSILTRPEDRVPPLGQDGEDQQLPVSILTRPEDRVPRPVEHGVKVVVDRVSILTRPEDRVPRASVLLPLRRFRHVSILTRPEDRVPPTRATSGSSRRPGFNPHPARRPGATKWRRWRLRPKPCFNPHPARRPGATREWHKQYGRLRVSILTRPEDRVPLYHEQQILVVLAFVSILTRPEDRVPRSPLR